MKDMWLDEEVNGGKGKRDEGVFVIDEGYWWAKFWGRRRRWFGESVQGDILTGNHTSFSERSN